MTRMRPILIILILVLTMVMISGCTFTIGTQRLMLRPGTRVPSRTVEQYDGEQIHYEAMDPEGDSIFVFIRGQL